MFSGATPLMTMECILGLLKASPDLRPHATLQHLCLCPMGNSPSLLLEAPPLPRIPCSWRPRLLCSYVSDGWRGCGLTVDVEGASPAPERDGDGAPAQDGDIGILNLYVQVIFTSWISHHMIDPHMSNTISLLFSIQVVDWNLTSLARSICCCMVFYMV